MEKAIVFCGSFAGKFGEDVCKNLGVEPGRARYDVFANGEHCPEILESVRRKSAFFIQSFKPDPNAAWMETLTFIDALKRASTAERIGVLPYVAYQRQDSRGDNRRVPVTLRLTAKLIEAAGATGIMTSEPHAKQNEAAFDIPVDQVFPRKAFIKAFQEDEVLAAALRDRRLVIVAPDAGAAQRADAYARRLEGAEVAVVLKRRTGTNQSEALQVVGDVRGKACVILDDMVDTAGTLVHAAARLVDAGAASVDASMTHLVLSGPAVSRIRESVIRRVYGTDSAAHDDTIFADPKFCKVSLAPFYAEAIKRVMKGDSVSALSN